MSIDFLSSRPLSMRRICTIPDKLNYDRFTLVVEGLKNLVADLAGAQLGQPESGR